MFCLLNSLVPQEITQKLHIATFIHKFITEKINKVYLKVAILMQSLKNELGFHVFNSIKKFTRLI